MIFRKRLLRTAFLGMMVSVFLAVGASATYVGVGTVNASALRLRSDTSTESDILATAEQGATVVVVEQGENGWCKVDYQTIEGYMLAEYLDIATTVETELGIGSVTNVSSKLNVRAGAGTDFERVGTLHNRDKVTLLGMENGWFKVSYDDVVGYVSGDYITLCMDEDGHRADENDSASVNSIRQEIIAYAEQFIGCPYVWGGSGPKSFDCSGYTQYVMKQFGYSLIHGATSQSKSGVAVSCDELLPGDLVFFHTFDSSYYITHVGIYAGNGQFLHASSSKGITYTSLYSDYYSKAYVCARRIIND